MLLNLLLTMHSAYFQGSVAMTDFITETTTHL